jgi:DNA repair exonuclease SbcCD nuclease subunit
MKIAIITDTHWGVRNDSTVFLENNKKFLENVFFPTITSLGINDILHLGDLVDRRKYINYNTATRLRQDFLDPIFGRGFNLHIVAGNHDTYFKNTNEVNALRELVVGKYPNATIYDKHAEIVQFDNLPMLLIPWICDDNRKQVLDQIQRGGASICAGHLEIQGFEMYRGSIVSHGDDRSTFGRFDMVLSGHYHHRSSDGSVFYLGSHGEFTWSDYDDPRGFHILDTETLELTFIENPYSMFKKVWYNDSDANFLNKQVDYSQFKDTILKVIVTEKTNPLWFDKFIENIESENPIEIQIVEDHLNLALGDDQDIINEAESTLDIFKKYIDTYDFKNINKDKLQNKISELYTEALTIE